MSLINPVAQRRIEATAMMLCAMVAYHHLGFEWSRFAIWFFLPDISILAYVAGPQIGGTAYNCAHFFLWPLLVGSVGALGGDVIAQQVALIWGSHIAFDRMPGYGLKRKESFCHTDMGIRTPAGAPPWLLPREQA